MTIQEQLNKDFDELVSNLNGAANHPFNLKRKEAMENFNQLGFPTTKHEEWKYSNVKKIVSESYQFHAPSAISKADIDTISLPNLHGNVLYFINGVYKPEFSNIVSTKQGLEILTLKEAQEQKHELLATYFAKYTDNKTEAFTALNTALAHDGVVVFVPAHTTIEEPIIIRMINDVQESNAGMQIRNLIVVEKNAEVKIAEAYRTLGKNAAFSNVVTELFIAEDARVDFYKVQNENNASAHIGTTQVYQKDKSYFHAATFTINGGFVRNNLNLILDGESIDSHMYGLYLPNNKQHIDNHTMVDHRKPNSISNELYKGILMDKATGVFNGKIFVRQDAQKTNAYQNCRNVLVSESASMNTKPQLEIWADDVKCSHGTTTGQLNDEAVFYMQSRGIPKKEAIRLQLQAFAEDVVSKIKIDTIQDYLEELIIEKLKM